MEDSRGLLKLINSKECNEILSEEDKNIIEVKLWTFLGKRIERYTMGDSSSVPIEIAEEIFKSICFSLELYLRDNKDGILLLKNNDLDTLLKKSWTVIERKIEEGKELLEKVKITSVKLGNISYDDTVREITQFFKRYDYRFLAHNIECSIDYQLSIPVSEDLQGIEYINKYLSNLLIENKFCKNFNLDKVINLLESYCSDYKGFLINIFEPVLTNAIGIMLIDGDVMSLEISELQRMMITKSLLNKDKEQMVLSLKKSAYKLFNILGIREEGNKLYIEETAIKLYERIKVALENHSLKNVFLSFKYDSKIEEIVFKDNLSMDNEKLRDLIDEINDCRYIYDKIQIVESEISSISDLIEILNECFWGDEVIELLKTYSEEELLVINHYLEGEGDLFTSNSKWEVVFKEYFIKNVVDKNKY